MGLCWVWYVHVSCLLPVAAAAAAGYFQDNIVTHLVAGLGAGFFAVCVGSPVDVVKSRVMGELTVCTRAAAMGGKTSCRHYPDT
jgi:hypothetical protein